jgi:hypothetical protein
MKFTLWVMTLKNHLKNNTENIKEKGKTAINEYLQEVGSC